MGDDPRSRDDADDTLVPYHEVHPKEQWQTEIAQATAALAARDTSCPSCRHAARAPAGEHVEVGLAVRLPEDPLAWDRLLRHQRGRR